MGCCTAKEAHEPPPAGGKGHGAAAGKTKTSTVVPAHTASAGVSRKDSPPIRERKMSMRTQRRLEDKLARGAKTRMVNLEDEPITLATVESLKQLHGLKVVDMKGTGIEEVPDFSSSATTLKRLDISRNKIKELPTMTAFAKVNQMDVSYNSLMTLPDLSGMTQLRELCVCFNVIRTIPAPLPTSLRVLKLAGNRLTEVPPAVFALPKLTVLELRNNELESFGDEEKVARLDELKTLDISSNRLRALPDALFSRTALTELTIANNALTEKDLKKMPSFDAWMQRKASVINRKIQGGATFELIK